MTSLLSGSLAKTIANAAKTIFLDATLQHDTPNAGADAFDPAAPTPATYSCKAIVESYSTYFRAQGLVEQNDRKILILAATLAITPATGDKISVSGGTYTIVNVGTDPATAVWECQGRG